MFGKIVSGFRVRGRGVMCRPRPVFWTGFGFVRRGAVCGTYLRHRRGASFHRGVRGRVGGLLGHRALARTIRVSETPRFGRPFFLATERCLALARTLA